MHKSFALGFQFSDRLKSQLPFSEGTKKNVNTKVRLLVFILVMKTLLANHVYHGFSLLRVRNMATHKHWYMF
jgi:hypothetical protein